MPRINLVKNIMPLKHSSKHMAIQMPVNPKLPTSKNDKGIRTHHKLTRLSTLLISVSPAPLSTPAATMLAPYKGSAKASILPN